MARLNEVVRLVHGTMIYDNSRISGPELLLQVENGVMEVNNLDQAKPAHARIAAIVGGALGVRVTSRPEFP